MQERRRVGNRTATAEECRYDGEENESAYRFKHLHADREQRYHRSVFFKGTFSYPRVQIRSDLALRGSST